MLLQRLATLCCLAATAALASAFVVVPQAPQHRTQGGKGVVLMAQRHYEKMSRGDFLLKSALAVRK